MIEYQDILKDIKSKRNKLEGGILNERTDGIAR